jgi:hypothetical protein
VGMITVTSYMAAHSQEIVLSDKDIDAIILSRKLGVFP